MQVMSTAEQGSELQKRAAQDILSVTDSTLSQQNALWARAGEAAIQAANKAESAFTKVFDRAGSGVQQFGDSLLKALVAPQVDLLKVGLTTIKFNEQGQEIRAAAQKFVLNISDDILHSMETGLSHLAASGLSQLLQIPIKLLRWCG